MLETHPVVFSFPLTFRNSVLDSSFLVVFPVWILYLESFDLLNLPSIESPLFKLVRLVPSVQVVGTHVPKASETSVNVRPDVLSHVADITEEMVLEVNHVVFLLSVNG
jgi:hypothetical protein